MVFFRAVSLVTLALTPLSSVVTAAETTATQTAGISPTADELNLDRLISVYEDVAAALSSVDDSTDADLVASRVAADFLLLRGMGKELFDSASGSEVSSDSLRSFRLRRQQAGATVQTATARLRKNSCFGSEALPAALSLSSLVSGKGPQGPATEIAMQELLANNREMMSLLLDEATTPASAVQVANLIGAAVRCEAVLSAYAQEVGSSHLDQEQRDFYAQRQQNFQIDLQNHHDRLREQDFYGNAFLREFIETRLTPTQE